LNRFFRSGLLPLILIVLVVYLASSQLMGGKNNEKKTTYSEFIGMVETGQVESAIFNPNKRKITFETKAGKKGSVNYESDQSGPVITKKLEDNNVNFDSKGTGTSAGWSQTFPQGQVKRRVVIRDSEAVESLRSKVGPFGHQINWENDAGALEPALLYRITVPRRSTDYNIG